MFIDLMKITMLLSAIVFIQSIAASSKFEKATFAGGCFWCMEKPFEKYDGVLDVVSGYTAGAENDPTYQDYGKKGHIEAIQVLFDPTVITYEELLDVFWRQIDPTDALGQFVDRGYEYSTAIFVHDEHQRKFAEESKIKIAASKMFQGDIVTPIKNASAFYRAEEYHQDYYKKKPLRYKYYRLGSGRDRYLKEVWGDQKKNGQKTMRPKSFKKPDDAELKSNLSSIQYRVTQKGGTEKPFDNAYWDNKESGIYVDIVSKEPLFSSKDKFKSGTGWPSFVRPIGSGQVVEKKDRSLFGERREIRSKEADSHLGHIFDDGPEPIGLRYCINSAALEFIPKEELESRGYAEYMKSFE